MKDQREVEARALDDSELDQVTGGIGAQAPTATEYCKNCNAPIAQDSLIDSGYKCTKCGHTDTLSWALL